MMNDSVKDDVQGTNQEQDVAQESVQATFNIEKIYVKELSLESPHSPQAFLERGQPDITVQLHTEAGLLDDKQGFFQVLLTATVTAKVGDKTLFLVEVAQAGIFQILHVPPQDVESILGIACPNILFPYLREVVSDSLTRAGFPPVLLAPVNFEALYKQRIAQSQDADAPMTLQ